MSWQERLRDVGERLASGQITTDDYRRLSEEILAEADAEAEAAATTQPAEPPRPAEQAKGKVHIPVSAAWEAPSGEMTQIVGTHDRTTVVSTPVADEPGEPGNPAT